MIGKTEKEADGIFGRHGRKGELSEVKRERLKNLIDTDDATNLAEDVKGN